MKLIDLDSSANFEHDDNSHVYKTSTAYAPPELIIVRNQYGLIHQESDPAQLDRVVHENSTGMKAHPSQDMWSLGCTLYLLCTGSTLFQCNVDDNLTDVSDVDLLASWNDKLKMKKLKQVKKHLPRNLLSLLLQKDPNKRLKASQVLNHPFITARRPSCFLRKNSEYNVFISYRVESDLKHAQLLYEGLTKRGLKVWWDRVPIIIRGQK